jgi:hypothetical protein
MGDLLLSSDSILMCPHGGLITHVPSTGTTYRISGRPPMLLGDTFVIAGCPFFTGGIGPCITAQWLTASTKLIVLGRPVLTVNSIGMCMAANGAPHGPVIIAAHQLGEREPDEFTRIDY